MLLCVAAGFALALQLTLQGLSFTVMFIFYSFSGLRLYSCNSVYPESCCSHVDNNCNKQIELQQSTVCMHEPYMHLL